MSLNSVRSEPNCSIQMNGRTDRQADMTKLIVALHNFANEPENRPTTISEFCPNFSLLFDI